MSKPQFKLAPLPGMAIRDVVKTKGGWTANLTPQPTAAMRDCVQCSLPFFSRSAANVVCLVCKETTDFDGGM